MPVESEFHHISPQPQSSGRIHQIHKDVTCRQGKIDDILSKTLHFLVYSKMVKDIPALSMFTHQKKKKQKTNMFTYSF